MRQKFVMGNWKMNGNISRITSMLNDVLQGISKEDTTQCVVFPPAIYLPLVESRLHNSSINWGAQNVYPQETGAFTGEISAPMLKEYGCRYVLVGHSERRNKFFEDEKFIAEKFHHVKDHGMIPVLCIGETYEQRDRGLTSNVLTKQLDAVFLEKSISFDQYVIAYEPVWAIGSGSSASPSQVQEVHQFIRTYLSDVGVDSENISILYGGSLNQQNASAVFEMPDVDGGLVGGASLDVTQFLEIIKCINCY